MSQSLNDSANPSPGFIHFRSAVPTAISTPSQRAAIVGVGGRVALATSSFFNSSSRLRASGPNGVSPKCLMKFSNKDESVVFFAHAHILSASPTLAVPEVEAIGVALK